jgi:DNA adenine methylase
MSAKPFVKWAGGKARLLKQIEPYLPQELKDGQIQHYVEPFVGGGALFFSICEQYSIKTAYLSDLNHDLILSYIVIQQKPQELLDRLTQYQQMYSTANQNKRKEIFLEARKDFNERRFGTNHTKISESEIQRAAQFIFLNKTCFNGLFRLNAKGEFNVPHGRHKQAYIADADNILAVSNILQNTDIVHADYTACFTKVTSDSFVYLDPPYRPITQTSNFTSYTGAGFNDDKQIELSRFFHKLDRETNAKIMLSNSDPANANPQDDFFYKNYHGYTISKISAGRAINCVGGKRGKITELLITNYQ